MEELGQLGDKVRQRIEREVNCKTDFSMSVEGQALYFSEKLAQIIRPKNQSDRTCFRRITNWLLRGVKEHEYRPEIFEKVLRYAIEASGPDSRNPAAVFMKILKEEMGYGTEKT